MVGHYHTPKTWLLLFPYEREYVLKTLTAHKIKISEAYLGPYQTSIITKNPNSAKKPIKDVWQGPKYPSGLELKFSRVNVKKYP